MFEVFKGKSKKPRFDRKVLRKNDISLLTLDERWYSLFSNTPKTPEIALCEERLKELLKEQSRLTAESKDILVKKKNYLDRIINLTTDVFEKKDEAAKAEMQACEKEIIRINDRIAEIEQALDKIPEAMKEVNLELLEHTVNIVYFKMRENKKRVDALEKLIEETREKLKAYIDEKETLSEDDTDIYSYFHDLLGGEELERLDREYFGDGK